MKFLLVPAVVVVIVLLAVVAMTARSARAEDAPAATQPAVTPMTLAQFDAMRQEKDAVVLDVRTPKEFAAGHVPGAVNINWHAHDFNDQVGKLDKSKKYLVHCHAGVRSAAATNRMSTLGFTQLFDFTGGWATYEKSGEPVAK